MKVRVSLHTVLSALCSLFKPSASGTKTGIAKPAGAADDAQAATGVPAFACSVTSVDWLRAKCSRCPQIFSDKHWGNDDDRMLLPKSTGNLTLFGRTSIHQGYVGMRVLEEPLCGVSQAKT